MRAHLALMAIGLAGLIFAARAEDRLPTLIVSIPEGTNLIDFAREDLGEAYRRIGYDMVLRPLPSARAIEAANSGETDAEAGRVPEATAAYPDLLRIPEPLLQLHLQALTAQPIDLPAGWEGLHGHHLCVSLGDRVTESRTATSQRDIVRNLESGLKMLRAGRCDVMIVNEYSWLEIDHLHLGPFCPAGLLETVDIFHFVNRRHADLIPALTAAMEEERKDGTTEHALAPLLHATEDAKARNSCGAESPRDTMPAHS